LVYTPRVYTRFAVWLVTFIQLVYGLRHLVTFVFLVPSLRLVYGYHTPRCPHVHYVCGPFTDAHYVYAHTPRMVTRLVYTPGYYTFPFYGWLQLPLLPVAGSFTFVYITVRSLRLIGCTAQFRYYWVTFARWLPGLRTFG